MNDQVFSDGIGTISVIGGTVRMDLVVYSATERDANGQPQAVFQQRVIMGADAFLRAAEKMQEAAEAVAKRIAAAKPEPAAGTPVQPVQTIERPNQEASSRPATDLKPPVKPPFP